MVVLVAAFAQAVPAVAQDAWRVRSLTPPAEGHHVGGVALDRTGNVYVADFDFTVWRVSPEGAMEVLHEGLYGASGNAIDHRGRLLQSSFHDDRVVRIARDGRIVQQVTTGFDGPVGVLPDVEGDGFHVANCLADDLTYVSADGTTSVVAESELFACPNGLARGPEGELVVVNFRDGRVLAVEPPNVRVLADLPSPGLGHVCLLGDRLLVTAFKAHRVYEVETDGAYRVLAGTGVRGVTDGPAPEALLSYPNGIACDASADRAYINEFLGAHIQDLPRRTQTRVLERVSR